MSLVNGVTLILGVTSSASNTVCLYCLSSINDAMDSFYQDCLIGTMGFSNNVDAWEDDVYDASCSIYPYSVCPVLLQFYNSCTCDMLISDLFAE